MASSTTADPQPSLSLGPLAATARRAVGPIAWAVLECVAAAAAIERDGEAVSHISVRGVAEMLGIAKDSAARALRRLAADRLVTYVPSRADDGRFRSSHYRLDLPAGLFVHFDPPSPVPRVPTPRHAQPRLPVNQLSLIDALDPDR